MNYCSIYNIVIFMIIMWLCLPCTPPWTNSTRWDCIYGAMTRAVWFLLIFYLLITFLKCTSRTLIYLTISPLSSSLVYCNSDSASSSPFSIHQTASIVQNMNEISLYRFGLNLVGNTCINFYRLYLEILVSIRTALLWKYLHLGTLSCFWISDASQPCFRLLLKSEAGASFSLYHKNN